MTVFYNTSFRGHYPVGTAAIVRANNAREAAGLLQQELKESNPFLEQEIIEEDMIEFTGSVEILQDGNY